jgi:hypothetical protein
MSGVKSVFRSDTKTVSTFEDRIMKKTLCGTQQFQTEKGNFIQLVASHNIHDRENRPLTELPPTLKVNTLGLLGNY